MKVQVYTAISGDLRIADYYGLSEKSYKRLKKAGLPVYKAMSGSLNLRDARGYTKEQIAAIKKLIEE